MRGQLLVDGVPVGTTGGTSVTNEAELGVAYLTGSDLTTTGGFEYQAATNTLLVSNIVVSAAANVDSLNVAGVVTIDEADGIKVGAGLAGIGCDTDQF